MASAPHFERLSLSGFEALLRQFPFTRAIDVVHMHHTWRPRRADFRGEATIQAMWLYHTRNNGWSDIAQHITIDPEGFIWTGRNFNRPPASAAGYNGSASRGPFMFEMVGDFDLGEDPFDGEQRRTAIGVIAAVQRRFGLDVDALRFHHQMTPKSCPGTGIPMAEVLAEVAAVRREPRSVRQAGTDDRSRRRGAADGRVRAAIEALGRGHDLPPDPSDAELKEGHAPLLIRDPDGIIDGNGAPDGTRGSAGTAAVARALQLDARQRRLLERHVVNLRAGCFCDSGDYQTRPEDVEAIFGTHLPRWLADGEGERRDVVFYAHGGLNDEAEGLAIALKQIPWWLDNEVYPIHFVWETGLFDSLIDRILGRRERDIRDWTNRRVEDLARACRGLWAQMKTSADRASRATVEPGGPEGGAHFVAGRLGAFCAANPGLRLHAGGHSAGSIFLAHFLTAGRPLKVPTFESLHLMAPAISMAVFKAMLLDEVGPDGLVRQIDVFTMRDELERQDTVTQLYRGSLLILISRALEDIVDTPLLGLERSIRADTEVSRLLGVDGAGTPGEVVWSTTGSVTGRSASQARHHGDFDDDRPTMNSILRRVRGLSDTDPIIDFPEADVALAGPPSPGEADYPARQEAALPGPASGAPPAPVPAPAPVAAPAVAPAAVPVAVPIAQPVQPTGSVRPSPANGATRRRALCVGINAYPEPADRLSGCVNDASRWQEALKGLGFSVSSLHDEQATREAVLGGLRELIGNSRDGDVIVFQYAGHGTQITDQDGDESDGRDEAYCPVDFRSGALLIDDDLAGAVRLLPDGVNLTVFSDSCHSGTNFRAVPADLRAMGASGTPLLPEGARRRKVEPGPALERAHRAFREALGRPAARQVRQRGDVNELREIKFAACLDPQYAYEANGGGMYTGHAVPLIVRACSEQWTNARFLKTVVSAFGETRAVQEPMLDAAGAARGRVFLAPFRAA